MADKTGKSWMAVGETDDPNAVIESFEAEAAVTKGTPVYLSSDDKVSPSPGGDDAIGIAVKTAAIGDMCPVLTSGRVKVTANGAITRGKAVCGAATYTVFYNRKLGTALESAVNDGDLIYIKAGK